MKILYLLQDLPYPITNGVRVKVFNLIEFMSREHECHILSFGNNDSHARALEFQKKVPGVKIIDLLPTRSGLMLQLRRLFHFVRGEPLFFARAWSKTFAAAVRNALKDAEYDLIHIDALAMSQYIYMCGSIPTVLSTTDAMSLVYLYAAEACPSLSGKLCRLYEAKTVLRLERKIFPLFSKVHVVAKFDRDDLASKVPSADIEFVEHVAPDEVLKFKIPTHVTTEKSRILFTGSVQSDTKARGLLDFLANAYTAIRQECPDVEMVILGSISDKELIEKINKVPGVHIKGWVADYGEEILKANVLIFMDVTPMGIKTRVLYALGLGKAIVATPEAVTGLEVIDGVHYYERTLNNGFAEAVISLLNNQEMQKTMGINARNLILEKHNMHNVGPKWIKLYESAITKNKHKMCAEKAN